MDWSMLVAVALVGAFAGYLLGLLVRTAFVERGGGGGGEDPPVPGPEGPKGSAVDFDQWELEIAGRDLALEG